MSLLPIPFENHIPDELKRVYLSDQDAIAFIEMINTVILETQELVRNLEYLLSPERCPVDFLPELAQYLGVNLRGDDSERQQRIRIHEAIQRHRNSGLFNADVKPRIDAITGLSSQIVRNSDTDGFIWSGQAGDDTSPKNWSQWGGEEFDDPYSGMLWEGSGLELSTPGIILIDLGGDANTPTEEVIEKVISELLIDSEFAYLQIVLGYIGFESDSEDSLDESDMEGIFIPYPNGFIGVPPDESDSES